MSAAARNPIAAREREWGTSVTRRHDRPRKVVVVGGGPSGMQTAIAAAEGGHQVTLFERSQALGGHLKLLAKLPHRARWQDGIDWFAGAMRRAGVDVRVGEEGVATTAEIVAADVVLCATGARWQATGFSPVNPTVPALPGCAQDNVIDVAAAAEKPFEDATVLGERVVIIDESGEYLPLGVADVLSEMGTVVTVVTRHAGVGHHVTYSLDHGALFKRLAARDVEFRPATMVTAIEEARVAVVELWSGREDSIENVGTVVMSMLRASETELYDSIASVVPESRLIGDALVPRRTAAVIVDGHAAGFEL